MKKPVPQEISALFPKADDQLFSPAATLIGHFHLAWMGPGPSDKFSMYAGGYKYAAEKLMQDCLTTGHGLDYLVYPIVFLYRHYI